MFLTLSRIAVPLCESDKLASLSEGSLDAVLSFPPSQQLPGFLLVHTIPDVASLCVCAGIPVLCHAQTCLLHKQACEQWQLPPSAGRGEQRAPNSIERLVFLL